MMDDTTKQELLQLADWLEGYFGIGLPGIFISSEPLTDKNGDLDKNLGGILQRHYPSGEWRIVLQAHTSNPAVTLCHEAIHYLTKVTPETVSPTEQQIDNDAMELVRQFRQTSLRPRTE